MTSPTLITDPRFATFEDRFVNKEALIAELDVVFTTHATEHWLAVLELAGVPCAPINTIAQALRDPQVAARGVMFDLHHEKFGTIAHVASPIRVGGEPHARGSAPALGADTRSVMSDLLGYDPARIRSLAQSGVIAGPGMTD